MDQRSSDTSDQNHEEQPAPEGGQDSAGTSNADDAGKSRREREGRPGGSGEGSQATGHPGNAG